MLTTMDALIEERRGYRVRGLPDRVAQVDAAIKALTGTVVEPEPPIETASVEPTENARRGPGRPRKSDD